MQEPSADLYVIGLVKPLLAKKNTTRYCSLPPTAAAEFVKQRSLFREKKIIRVGLLLILYLIEK